MCLCPLSGEYVASFPHVLESSNRPPVPKPIRESQEPQWFCWLAVMPILALELRGLLPTALNPSLLQLGCKEAREPISDSTCYDPVRWHGISHQRSVRTVSWPACWWQWTWADDQSSYRGRSWRRVCSSRSVTWSLVSQSQSCLQKSYRHFCSSRNWNRNGRFSKKQELHFWFALVNFSNNERFLKEGGS